MSTNLRTRQCPIGGCSTMIMPELFACPRHWKLLDTSERQTIWDIYREWQAGRKTGEELRGVQQNVVNSVNARIGAEPKKTPLQDLAQEVLDVLAMQRRYFLGKEPENLIACKEAERALQKRCEAIVTPPLKKPSLFDQIEENEENDV